MEAETQRFQVGKLAAQIADTYTMKTNIDWELWREAAIWFVSMLVVFTLILIGNGRI